MTVTMTMNQSRSSVIETELWEKHQRIIELRRTVEQSFLELGALLSDWKTTQSYKLFGHSPPFSST